MGQGKLLLTALNFFLNWVLKQKRAHMERTVLFSKGSSTPLSRGSRGGNPRGDSQSQLPTATAGSLLKHCHPAPWREPAAASLSLPSFRFRFQPCFIPAVPLNPVSSWSVSQMSNYIIYWLHFSFCWRRCSGFRAQSEMVVVSHVKGPPLPAACLLIEMAQALRTSHGV